MDKKPKKIIIGISVGDLNGVGAELILKTFEDPRMFEFCTPVVFASNKAFQFLKKHLNMPVATQRVDSFERLSDKKLNIFSIWKESFNFEFGQETEEAGKRAIESLQEATKALKEKKIDALLTAPINKSNIQTKDFSFPGHTDFLAKELEGNPLMFMVSDELKVGLLTDHVAVKDVAGTITPKLIREKITTIYESLKKDFRVNKPKIAVLGINPHAGDNGVIGKEDEDILKPTIKDLYQKGMMVFGPYAADGFFGSNTYQKFDAVIASYHDQGLIPFKTLTFGNGVNYTAGLEAVRTSPDHGTAYDIAGKGKADASSFKEALFTAIQIVKNRKEYNGLTSNVLRKHKKI
ncbi:4-hydroxythreonine-4-phosphate dehydrogenase PdxA [Pseudofulvibacter geojedonensis]|uniref:4-hydroxythreonine-4-phosphate dehydrogenase PdxA n=1 Tax=Pseudofulvibacter geojedonensis TaxID=1123758 RepID=A0ABW3I0Q2_9FLAO